MLYLRFAEEVPPSAGGLLRPDVEASAVSTENTATLTQATDTGAMSNTLIWFMSHTLMEMVVNSSFHVQLSHPNQS